MYYHRLYTTSFSEFAFILSLCVFDCFIYTFCGVSTLLNIAAPPFWAIKAFKLPHKNRIFSMATEIMEEIQVVIEKDGIDRKNERR